MLASPLLAGLPGIQHGFGTRQAPLSQDGMAALRQIHSSLVLRAEQPGIAGEGDALLTNRAGIPLSIRTADCYPILLADPKTRAVAAIHAGWRGTAAHIVGETLHKMQTEFGTTPGDVYASIGPGIGACCYEVGAEVARQFGRSEAGYLDLAEENRRQLIELGIALGRIELVGLCTRCGADQFHSYRRDKEGAGRMISFITLNVL